MSCLPCLEWHPFSLASAPDADSDNLEFHIAVSSGQADLDEANVKVKAKTGELLISRRNNLLDWICPYRVPRSEAEELDGSYHAKLSGRFLELTDKTGTTVRTLTPQEQWTGKLWNLIADDSGDLDDQQCARAKPRHCCRRHFLSGRPIFCLTSR